VSQSKVIRSWRVQPGRPCGYHIWFDPAVEHVSLLEGPVTDLDFPSDEAQEEVDTDPQQTLPFRVDGSVSGRGKREALTLDITEESFQPLEEGLTKIPF